MTMTKDQNAAKMEDIKENNQVQTEVSETDANKTPLELAGIDSTIGSLVSSAAESEEDLSSRENSDRSSSRKKNRVKFADSMSSWSSIDQDGFLFNPDPFSLVKRQCPRHILNSMAKHCKTPDADLDEFGVVSKRALPEHYYANTGTVGPGNNRRTKDIGTPRTPSFWRDRHAAEDFSNPRCFANPKNNVKLITMDDMQNGYLDTSLKSPSNGLPQSPSKVIRFTNSTGGDDQSRHTDSPGNSSQNTTKSPRLGGGDPEGFYYGQRRPGVKVHSCVTDGL